MILLTRKGNISLWMKSICFEVCCYKLHFLQWWNSVWTVLASTLCRSRTSKSVFFSCRSWCCCRLVWTSLENSCWRVSNSHSTVTDPYAENIEIFELDLALGRALESYVSQSPCLWKNRTLFIWSSAQDYTRAAVQIREGLFTGHDIIPHIPRIWVLVRDRHSCAEESGARVHITVR